MFQAVRQIPAPTVILNIFDHCISMYDGEHKVHSFRCTEQYRHMAFAQLTYRESLRDIELLSPGSDKPNRQIIRSANQSQYPVSANLFAQGGPCHRCGRLSDRQVMWHQQ